MKNLRYALLTAFAASALVLAPVQYSWATGADNGENGEAADNGENGDNGDNGDNGQNDDNGQNGDNGDNGPDDSAAASAPAAASDDNDGDRGATCPFVVADANNDGWVSYAESLRCFPSLRPTEFAALDRDNNLVLTQGEWTYVESHT